MAAASTAAPKTSADCVVKSRSRMTSAATGAGEISRIPIGSLMIWTASSSR